MSQPFSTERQLLTVEDAAEVLNCSEGTVRNRIRDGRITSKRDGRRVVIERAELERYIAELPTYLDKPAA